MRAGQLQVAWRRAREGSASPARRPGPDAACVPGRSILTTRSSQDAELASLWTYAIPRNLSCVPIACLYRNSYLHGHVRLAVHFSRESYLELDS